jgi:hypothetical protein
MSDSPCEILFPIVGTKVRVDAFIAPYDVWRELSAAASMMYEAIEQVQNLTKEDYIRDFYLASVAESAGNKMRPDALEVIVLRLTDSAEIAEDGGIRPASIPDVRLD